MRLSDNDFDRDVEAARRWMKRLKRLMRDAPENLAAVVEGHSIDFFVQHDPGVPFFDMWVGKIDQCNNESIGRVDTPFPMVGGDPY